MSSAQTLPRKSRELIEEAFGCKVFDKYGSREFSRHRLRVRRARRPPRRGRGLHRRAAARRPARAAGRDRRGRDHRPQQLLHAVHPLPHRRPRRGAWTTTPSHLRPRAAAHRRHRGPRAVDHPGHRRALRARAPSSRTRSRSTTTRSSVPGRAGGAAARSRFRVVKGGALLGRHARRGARRSSASTSATTCASTSSSSTTSSWCARASGWRACPSSRSTSSSAASSSRAAAAPEPRAARARPMSRCVVVTGSEGFVGRHLRRALEARGCTVLGVDKPGTGRGARAGPVGPGLRRRRARRALRSAQVSGVIYMAATITRGSSVDGTGACEPARHRRCRGAELRGVRAARPGDALRLLLDVQDLRPARRARSIRSGRRSAPTRTRTAAPSRSRSACWPSPRRAAGCATRSCGRPASTVRASTCTTRSRCSCGAVGGPRADGVRHRPRRARRRVRARPRVLPGRSLLAQGEGAFHATGDRSRTIAEVAEACCDVIAELGGPSGVQPQFDESRAAEVVDRSGVRLRALARAARLRPDAARRRHRRRGALAARGREPHRVRRLLAVAAARAERGVGSARLQPARFAQTGRSMKVVVTGATGHLGTYTVAGLAALGHEVIAASRSGALPALPFGAQQHGGSVRAIALDLTRDDAVAALAAELAPNAVLVHLAAYHPEATAATTARDRSALLDTNVHGTMRALEAARREKGGVARSRVRVDVRGLRRARKRADRRERARRAAHRLRRDQARGRGSSDLVRLRRAHARGRAALPRDLRPRRAYAPRAAELPARGGERRAPDHPR